MKLLLSTTFEVPFPKTFSAQVPRADFWLKCFIDDHFDGSDNRIC